MRSEHPFRKGLVKVERNIRRMEGLAVTARWYWDSENPTAAYEKTLALAETAERTLLTARDLPVCTGAPKAREEVTRISRNCIPVEMGFTGNNWFCIRFPALLPKKETGSAQVVRSFLYPALGEFFQRLPPVRYRDCVLIFRHVYSRDRPERQRRDHDNIEVNMVADAVAFYTMPDDGPLVCARYYCSAAAKSDRTEVYVVPQCDFKYWLAMEAGMPEEGVQLHDTPY